MVDVSIVIPCFNGARYVSRAIESALAQREIDVEVVVVDDGSTDESPTIIEAFGQHVQSIRTNNHGAACARNIGARISRGKYLQFLDCDDWYEPDKSRVLLESIRRTQSDLVWCRGMLHTEDGICRPEKFSRLEKNADPLAFFLLNNPGTNAVMMSKMLFDAVGGFREGLTAAQEFDLFVRMGATTAAVSYVDRVLYHIQLHSGSKISNSARPVDFFLRVLMQLALEMDASGKLNTPARKRAFAESISRHSLYVYRNRATASAKAGFELALKLDRVYCADNRRVVGLCYRFLGPNSTEFILENLRRFRDALRRTHNWVCGSLRTRRHVS
jgi:glycosyltransferase involved in cell wall biosynthesis